MRQLLQQGIAKAARQDLHLQLSISMSRLLRLSSNLVLIIPNWVVNPASLLKDLVGAVALSSSSRTTTMGERTFAPNWLDTRRSVKTLR